jgi:hypothetical protein
MSDALAIFGMLLIYKLAILLVGVLSIYMGFRLFLADKVTPAGDLSAKSGVYALQLRGGAPGIFFSLFGTVLICFSIAKGLDFSGGKGPVDTPVQQIIPDEPPVPD